VTIMVALGPKARALVDAGRGALRPTDGDRDRLETALRAQLGPAALPPQGSVAPPPVVATAAAGWKVAAAAVLGAGVIGVASYLAAGRGTSVSVPAASTVAPLVASIAVTVPAQGPVAPGAEPAAMPETAPALIVAPPIVPEGLAAPPRSRDRLAEEVALLSRATSALRAGRAADALKALDEHQTKFPGGVLTEERRSAKAQALCSLGRVSEGRAELSHLAPQSPAAARARKVCDSGS